MSLTAAGASFAEARSTPRAVNAVPSTTAAITRRDTREGSRIIGNALPEGGQGSSSGQDREEGESRVLYPFRSQGPSILPPSRRERRFDDAFQLLPERPHVRYHRSGQRPPGVLCTGVQLAQP